MTKTTNLQVFWFIHYVASTTSHFCCYYSHRVLLCHAWTSPSFQKFPHPSQISPTLFPSYYSIFFSHPSNCSSLYLTSPSSSTLPSPSLSDESINFSRSICGTQWLHGASLLLRRKLISRSDPRSINHRPSTCSSPRPCLLLFPFHLTSRHSPSCHILYGSLLTYTCVHIHV